MEIRYAQLNDKTEWYKLDRHLPEKEFEEKIRTQQGYVLTEDDKVIGVLRYNLFWDNTIMTSTQVDEEAQHFYRKLGYKDCGGFTVDVPGYEQPMEMIMIKAL